VQEEMKDTSFTGDLGKVTDNATERDNNY